MNITKESTGDLTATLRLAIEPADYTEAVEKQIADYRKKANIPGFRPGHIPAGLVKKMYGKAIIADEVNRLIGEKLYQYIREEKLNILGNPIPNMEKNNAIDFDHQDTFEFYFDLGLTPEFAIPVDQDLDITDYEILVDESMVTKYIEDTRKRFGKKVETEMQEGDQPTDDSSVSNVDKPEPEVIPAEMGPEFYNSVYPGLDLASEEDFRAQVRKDAAQGFKDETDKMLFDNITQALVKNTEMTLPDEFLKRWLVENNEGKFTPEQIEQEYPAFKESMKWQLIENRLIKDNGITVTDADIRNYVKMYFFRQINLDVMDEDMQKRYESIIDTFMENKEQVQRINDQIYNARLMEYFKANITVHKKEITYEEYVQMMSEHHAHHHHHHDHDHDHDHGHGHDHDHDHDHHHDHTH